MRDAGRCAVPSSEAHCRLTSDGGRGLGLGGAALQQVACRQRLPDVSLSGQNHLAGGRAMRARRLTTCRGSAGRGPKHSRAPAKAPPVLWNWLGKPLPAVEKQNNERGACERLVGRCPQSSGRGQVQTPALCRPSELLRWGSLAAPGPWFPLQPQQAGGEAAGGLTGTGGRRGGREQECEGEEHICGGRQSAEGEKSVKLGCAEQMKMQR